MYNTYCYSPFDFYKCSEKNSFQINNIYDILYKLLTINFKISYTLENIINIET